MCLSEFKHILSGSMNMTDIAMNIVRDARALGVCAGDLLLVHSSFKSLRAPEATPADVIDGLIYALDGGTLVMPTLSYEHCGPDSPVFDARNTPSNVGAIHEYFRTHYPVRRSLCPTHSCAALGPMADELTRDHQLDDTPCGAHSPLRRLAEMGGRILFLGCSTDRNTSMHAIEEIAEPDYLFAGGAEYELTDMEGNVHRMNCRAHGFKGVTQRYGRVVQVMPPEAVHKGNILAADCTLLDARPMWRTALEYYSRDAHYFVDVE